MERKREIYSYNTLNVNSNTLNVANTHIPPQTHTVYTVCFLLNSVPVDGVL